MTQASDFDSFLKNLAKKAEAGLEKKTYTGCKCRKVGSTIIGRDRILRKLTTVFVNN